MQRRTVWLGFALTLLGMSFGVLLPTATWAGTTGKLTGVVVDAQTGEPLANANIVILGTTLGAASKDDGEYFILNVPGGTYDIRVSFMGYKPEVRTGVRVAPDFTKEEDFRLEPTTLSIVEPVQVAAERPLIQRDRTGTVRFIGGEEIQNQPIRGYQEAASLQAGVVNRGAVLRAPGDTRLEEATNQPRLYIRGGRSNEVAYFVDGFSQQDPLTGISTTAINQNAIDQVVVQTGGFDAEYGKIMSGIVNVVTREGGQDYFGSLELITDNLAGDWIGAKRYDNNVYDGSFGGPVPGMDNMSFFFSGERRWSRDRTPKPVEESLVSDLLAGVETLEFEDDSLVYQDDQLPANTLGGWTWQGKLSWNLTPDLKLKVGTLGSKDRWQEFRQAYLFDADHTPRYEDTNQSVFASVTHTVNPSLFYEVGGTWFYTERFRGDGVHFKDLRAYGVNGSDGNPRFDPDVALFFYGDTTNGDHIWDDYLHRESSYIGFKGDLTYAWMQNHTGKGGFEFRRHTLRLYRHLFPVQVYKWFDPEGGAEPDDSAFLDVDRYGYAMDDPEEHVDEGLDGAKNPVDLGIYVQDKYEVGDFVFRAGLRYDYLSPETPRITDDNLPLGDDQTQLNEAEDLEDSKAYNKLSPRIGVGFPIGERTLFHANYGKFFQQPNLEDLYVSYSYLEHKAKTGGYFFAFGNPNLEPEETTAYEVGFTQQVSPTATFDMTAFYKDVKNLVEVISITAAPNNYSSYRNRDYGTIKGIDASLTLRRTDNIAANFYYTLSYADGTGSTSDTQRNIAWNAEEPPKQTAPLDFDQRHKFTINLDWRTGEGEGPLLGESFRPLENTGVNVLMSAGSGFPFTPTKPYDAVTLANVSSEPAGPINSRRGPWTFRVDLKASRSFNVSGFDLDFYVWVLNLFDRENPLTVYETTGDAFTTGWLGTPTGRVSYGTASARGLYDLRQDNPENFDIPRLVRFGLRTSF